MANRTATIHKVGRVGQRRQVVIPREIFDRLKMREGDLVAFAEKQGGILMKPKRIVDADDTILTPAEAKLVRRSMKQIRQGRFKLWRDVKDELGR
jgi:AbrB family looped-hinge helix DNA binding protein